MDRSDLRYNRCISHVQNADRIGMSHLVWIFLHCTKNTVQDCLKNFSMLTLANLLLVFEHLLVFENR